MTKDRFAEIGAQTQDVNNTSLIEPKPPQLVEKFLLEYYSRME